MPEDKYEVKDGLLLKNGTVFTGEYLGKKYKNGKEVSAVESDSTLSPEAASIVAGILAALTGGDEPKSTQQTTSTKDVLKITNAAARALLEEAAISAQLQGKISKEQVEAFVTLFNEEASKQIESAIRSVSSKITPGTKPEDVKKIVENYVTTTTVSYFNPKNLANDYVWSLINFKDETTLGGKSLGALQDVRAAIANNGIVDMSEAEIRTAAKNIARGRITLQDFNATLRSKLTLNYPQFADRFAANPDASARDIFDPYLSAMAKYLEIDKDSIQLDNEYLDKALRPDGAAGKMAPMSISDFIRTLKLSPESENTTWSNELARSAATGFAGMWGFGI